MPDFDVLFALPAAPVTLFAAWKAAKYCALTAFPGWLQRD